MNAYSEHLHHDRTPCQGPTRHFGWRQIIWGMAATGLVALCVGLWAVPAADGSLVLLRAGASIALLGAAWICAVIACRKRETVRLELDDANSEIRVMERGADGRYFLQQRHSLMQVSQLCYRDDQFLAWDLDGELAMQVPVETRKGRKTMQAMFAQ